MTENETLRPAIANVWKWSNWQIRKDVLGLWGSVMGDACIRIVDDPDRKKVYLSLLHPALLKIVDLDQWGNVKGYVIEETRYDPRETEEQITRPNYKRKKVTYQEIAERDGENVHYTTTLDGQPYAWDDVSAEWDEPYGFIPMVVIQHNNVGLEWGWSEFHPVVSKFREVDDLASKLSDQIRKMVDAPWLFAGVNNPKDKREIGTTHNAKTADRPEPGREEIPAIYGPVNASATPLVANLDISASSEYIQTILKDIERDYPELATDIKNVQGDISGRALRINRQPTEVKVSQRRATYDDCLVRAHQMAVAIGGMRGYEGFQGFDLTSYLAGKLDHSIGERPVFSKDPLDDLDYEKVFWDVGNAAKLAGVPLIVYLERQGWTPEEIAKITSSPDYKAKVAGFDMAIKMAEQGPTDPNATYQKKPGDKKADPNAKTNPDAGNK